MEYYTLDELENQYPAVENYVSANATKVLLNGIYPKNKMEYTMPSIEAIKGVSQTSMRFILSLKNGEKDTPKLYTSETFLEDLKTSYSEKNPYFYNAAQLKEFIVNVDISPIMKVAQTLAEKELNDGAEVTRNVFIRQATTVTTNEPQQIEFRKKYDDLVKERDSIESKIKLKEQEIGKMVGFLNTKKKVEKKNELKVLLATLSSINKQIDSLQGQLTLNEDKKIDISDVKLEIDWIELVKFYDYVLEKEGFRPDTAEDGGVRAANEIGLWKVTKYISPEERQTDLSENKKGEGDEEEKEKTGVGKFIDKLKKIPVIGTIVKGAEVVVKAVGKAVSATVKAVGNFFKKIFSDRRVKENIVKVAEIGGLNIYKFNYNWDKDTEQYGVIAQELLGTKYESAVFIDDETGLYKVDYEKLNEMVDIKSFITILNNNSED
jgi:hypothetical protein